jgi:hypothetical protein
MTMSNRRTLQVMLAAVGTVMVYGIFVWRQLPRLYATSGVTAKNCARIEPGMTAEDVERILCSRALTPEERLAVGNCPLSYRQLMHGTSHTGMGFRGAADPDPDPLIEKVYVGEEGLARVWFNSQEQTVSATFRSDPGALSRLPKKAAPVEWITSGLGW